MSDFEAKSDFASKSAIVGVTRHFLPSMELLPQNRPLLIMADLEAKFHLDRNFIFSGEFAEVKKSDIHGMGSRLHLYIIEIIYVKFRCIC